MASLWSRYSCQKETGAGVARTMGEDCCMRSLTDTRCGGILQKMSYFSQSDSRCGSSSPGQVVWESLSARIHKKGNS